MSAIIDFIPHTYYDGQATFQQPLHSVVDVSAYTDAAIFIHLLFASFVGEAIKFNILTAQENREGRYREVYTVEVEEDANVPYAHMVYLTAAGETGELHGFDRYLRVEVECREGQKAAFDVRGLMRTRS